MDVDSVLLETDPGITTVLAAALNHTMARSPEARAAYREIHGEDWVPLGNGAEVRDTSYTGTRG